MSFSALKQQQLAADNDWPIASYFKAYFDPEKALTLIALKDKMLDHLYADVAEQEPPFVFKQLLHDDHTTCELSAQDCLKLTLYKKNLFYRDIKNWTEHALKAFDPFLIRYIQEVLNEIVPCNGTWVKETTIYEYLIAKGGGAQEIGEHFKYVYQYRSNMYHVHRADHNGKITIQKLSAKKLKAIQQNILSSFQKALCCFSIMQPVTA